MSFDNGPASIPLAIVGMGCRLPGADNLDEFWRLILEGRSAVREMPADRMDQSLYFDPRKGVRGKTYSKLAATLSSREFDGNACPIPEELIRGVDNAHLLMCGVAADALRHAGIDPFNVPLRNTGVYIGHAQGSELGCDYTYATCVGEAAEFLREAPAFQQLPADEQDAVIKSLVNEVRSGLPHRTPDSPDVSACMVAGTISKAFGLTGPFLAINSACASSLQAMLLAARALQLGHIDMAIVGGASDCKGDSLVLFAHAQAMSATGSRPFDADADGLIVGEGYVAVVMKRLDRALADSDNVLAVVRGLGISSDGKGKSLWAPRKEGQIKAMQRAYCSAVDLAGLQYVEAHSTATQLGDATELNTLAEVLAPHFPPGHKIPVTSVKANIGHTLESAGLAGVIKTVLCMKHGLIPPASNITRLNPNIDWENSPVYVPLEPTPWPQPANGQPRRAGVNAFGIGGLNMHVVLDEYREPASGGCQLPDVRIGGLTSPARRGSTSDPPTDDSSITTGGMLSRRQSGEHGHASQAHGDSAVAVTPCHPAADSLTTDAIAVIGRGCIFPGAANLSAYWRLLQSGDDPKQHVPADRWRSDLALQPESREAFQTPCTLGGFITGYEHDWRRHKIPPKQIQQADPLQFMLLDAMDEAFAEAGYDQKEFDRDRVGVVVGTEFGGDFAFQLQLGLRIPELSRIIGRLLSERGLDAEQVQAAVNQFAETMLAHWPALIDETGSFSTSTLASRLGKTWNFMGGAAAIDAGDTSSLAALSIAVDMLLAGDCDMMVCAGGQRRMGLPEYETLALKGLLPQQEPRSPLDAGGDGYVPGEGVGVVLLKRLADARRDGDPIHAIIRGVAAAHTNDPAESTRLAIQRSLAISEIDGKSISAIELDATGSARVTGEQLSAIAESQRSSSRTNPLMVGSVASQIGHTQGAAGIASLLKASLEVSHETVPPAYGVSQAAANIARHPDTFKIPTEQTSLRGAAPDSSAAAAVISYSRGLVYQAIVEPAAAVPVRPESSAATEHSLQPLESAMSAHPDLSIPSTAAAAAPDIADLESFLINFVVEQTGYPPEVVELDADLEADLGIDSIKKAQLFGELQEYFDITPTGDVTLDDFPTLRHVVNFLAANQSQPVPETSSAILDVQAAESGNMSEGRSGTEPEDTVSGFAASPASDALAEKPKSTDGEPRTPLSSPLPTSEPRTSVSVSIPQGRASEGDAPSRLVRFAASSWDELQRKLNEAANHAESVFDSAETSGSFSASDRYRVAIVADSPAALARKSGQAAGALTQPAARRPLENQGIFIREVSTKRPRIAFVFPGQGSQYAGMLRTLVQQSPAAASELRTIDETLKRLGESSFAEIAWGDDASLGIDVWSTQLAMLLADTLMFGVLKSRDIMPDVVLGHSYGEYAALVASGAWELSEAIRVTRARCDGIENSLTSLGGMLATSATPADLAPLMQQVSGDVFIANINAPDQTVVGGRRPALRELERLLKGQSIQTRMLPVPCAFHTPLMQDAVPPLEESLQSADINAPRITTYSVADNRVVGSADDVRRNLAAHMTHPVKYADLIRQIADEAPTVFVEVGPQQALTRLNARILGDADVNLIACDNPKRPGLEQLLCVQALLDVCGAMDVISETKGVSVAAPRVERFEIVHFDATARRRAKMREAAGGGGGRSELMRVTARPAASHATMRSDDDRAHAIVPGGRASSAAESASQDSNGHSNSEPKRGLPLPPRVGNRVAESVAGTRESAGASSASAGATAVTAPSPSGSAESRSTIEAKGDVAVHDPEAAGVADAALGTSREELEAFLINFVVEQTGYPPEVVELDADLEADLGIDSIKKAQLFGELQEYFDVTPTEGVTLDDFPTLRHVVDFLAASAQSPSAVANVSNQEISNSGVRNHESDSRQSLFADTRPLPRDTRLSDPIVVQVRGTAYEIGHQHGAELKEPIRRALRRIVDLSDGNANELPIPREVASHPEKFFSAEIMDELRGIADGAEVSFGSVVAWNLILLSELGTSAKHLLVAGSQSASGSPLHALRDDLCLMGALSECLAPVVLIREKTDAIPVASVTFAGFVGALAGMNAARLTMGGFTPDMRHTREDVPGRHLLLVSQVLESSPAMTAAVDALRRVECGEWQCGLTQSGVDRVTIVSRNMGTVTVEQSADLAVRSTHPVADDFGEHSRWTMDRIVDELVASADRQTPHCLVILDGDSGEGHVGCRSGDAEGPLSQVSVSHFFPLRQNVPPPLDGGQQCDESRIDDPPYDLPPYDLPPYDLPVEDTRTRRFVMTMVPSAVPPRDGSTWTAKGPALILGTNPVAEALRRRLAETGVDAELIRSTCVADAVAELERHWARGPVPHLFLTSTRDSVKGDLNDLDVWQKVWDEQVLTSYFVCQRWLQLAHDAGCIDDCSVVAVTNLGGDFGFDSEVASPQSGGLTGLMKALCLEYFVLREHQGFLAKAIDAPADADAEILAANIIDELASGALDYEVAYVDGQRYLQLAVSRDAAVREHSEIRPGGTWVVTGGARGITAESALELGRRFGLKLHLLGTSPVPDIPLDKRDLDETGLARWRSEVMIAAREQGRKPNEAWAQIERSLEMDRSLRRFAEAGVRAIYHTCDVGNREALAAVLEEIRRTDGPIEGILHGAGIERPCRFEKKTPENVRATFDAKVSGAYHLMTLTRQDPVRHFIAYGSISGRLGSNGQTDYCTASDLLCKLTSWYRRQRPDCRAIAFHWHPWDEVGMAARPETRASLERTNGPALMPKSEGIRHLVREVYSPQENCEVLITDWEFHQRYYPEPAESTASRVDPVEDVPTPNGSENETVGVSTAEKSPVARIAARHVMRLVDAPLPDDPSFKISGSALILGENSAAVALRDRLKTRGVSTHLLPADNVTEALARLEEVCSVEPCRALFLMTGRDADDISLDGWLSTDDLTEQRVLLPYLIAQRWAQWLSEQEWNEPAVIAAAVSLGGEFGFTGEVPCPTGGGLSGLLKSIHVENVRSESRRFVVKVIDAPVDEPVERLADAIVREVESGTQDVEVAWSGGRRTVVQCLRESLPDERPTAPRRGGVWVVTGGARGITAATALEFGRRYGLKLHLIGRSPAPETNPPWRNATHAELKLIKRKIVMKAVSEGRSPEDDWDRVRKDREIFESLQSFAAAGVEATYHSCDVADRSALDRVLRQIRETDGPIEGIIHGAGYAKSARFESQSVDRVRRTFAPKIDGTLNLMALTREDPLTDFIAFGSLSGRFGGNGLADYAAANDLLAKLCCWFRTQRPRCRTSCLHWQTWDRIGMAMIADGVEITRNAFKMDFLSPEEGVAHLHDELCAGLPEGEVLITDGYFQQVFYPENAQVDTKPDAAADGMLSRPTGGMLSRQQAGEHERTAAESHGDPADAVTPCHPTGPLIDRVEHADDGRSVNASIVFDAAADGMLSRPTGGVLSRQQAGEHERTAAESHVDAADAVTPCHASGPLIDRVERADDGRSVNASIVFDPANDPFLVQHRLRDKPFLPGVVGIETLLQAAAAGGMLSCRQAGEHGGVAAAAWDPSPEIGLIRDVVITNGLAFHSDESVTATVHVTADGDSLACRLTTELRNRQGRVVDPQRLHVSGIVEPCSRGELTIADGPARPPLGWFPHQYSDDGLLTHGPAFRCLTDIAFQYDGGWGRIVAPDPRELAGRRPSEGWHLPLAILDACLVTCGSFVFLQFGGQFEVPHGFERLQWGRQPRAGETCIVRTYFRGRDERHSRFDFALYGENDEPLLHAVGYRTIRVGGNS